MWATFSCMFRLSSLPATAAFIASPGITVVCWFLAFLLLPTVLAAFIIMCLVCNCLAVFLFFTFRWAFAEWCARFNHLYDLLTRSENKERNEEHPLVHSLGLGILPCSSSWFGILCTRRRHGHSYSPALDICVRELDELIGGVHIVRCRSFGHVLPPLGRGYVCELNASPRLFSETNPPSGQVLNGKC